MGTVENNNHQLIVYSHIITYGSAATLEITGQIHEEIETMWNEPGAIISVKGTEFKVVFKITASFEPTITPIEIYQNLDPKNNYFRIEEFAHSNISFVDGFGCNTGYFKLENLYKGSITVAHEYGHTLGLDHPHDLDIRGKGIPGIMYPRGTLVNPQYQYEPDKPAGTRGGTIHPIFRKVLQRDIDNLQLHHLAFANGQAVLGQLSNIWHDAHSEITPGN